MLVADYAVSSVFLFALFSASWPGLLFGVLILAVALAATIATISRALTGRPHVLGALTVTVMITAVGAYAVLTGSLVPMTTQQDWPLHLLVCTLAAGTLGLFLGPWPLRVVGAVSAMALFAAMSLLPVR